MPPLRGYFGRRGQENRKVSRLLAARSKGRIAKSNGGQSLEMTKPRSLVVVESSVRSEAQPTLRLRSGQGWLRHASGGREARSLCRQAVEEVDDRLDPAIEVRDVELLVGGVQIVVGQAQAHHHRGNLQHVFEVGHDGNGSA